MRKTLLRETLLRKTLFQKTTTAAAAVLAAASMLAAPRLDAQQTQEAAEPATPPPAAPLVDSLPDVVARVEGHPITKNQLLRQADAMRRQAMQAGVQDPAHQGKEFLFLVVDALIGEYLAYLDGQSRGITVSDAEVDARVQQIAAAYDDEATFEQALKARGMDRELLRQETRQQLAIDKLFDEDIEADLNLSENELRAFYDENPNRYQHPPRLRARHILKQVPQGETGDAQRAELVELRRKIVEDGTEFGELAVSSSDDPTTRDLGGDMGWIRIMGAPTSIGRVLAGFEVGAISDVVETQLGLHLFQVLERQPARPMTFEEARPAVTRSLTTLRAREEVQRRLAELKAEADVEILM